jgi:hypothetical protein
VTGPGLQWQAAVGVRKGQDELRTAIERELAQLAPDIARLAEKYGFPSGRRSGSSAPPTPVRRRPPPKESAPAAACSTSTARIATPPTR